MQSICSSNKRILNIKEGDIFTFDYINNSINSKKELLTFYCPVCKKTEKAIYLYDYISYHDCYNGIEFFCNNCLSMFKTMPEAKIKLISMSLII